MKLIKSLRARVVTAYANRIWRKMKEAANEKMRQEKTMVYVTSPATDIRKLELYTAGTFRKLKYRTGMDQRENTLAKLREECWYHTTDKFGENGMDPRTEEVHRLKYVQVMLGLAGAL